MHKKIIFLLLFIYFSSGLAQSERDTALQQIMKLFGGRWIGKGTSPSGEKIVSTLNFSWTLNHKFIKVKNELKRGKKNVLVAEATYGWHPVLRQVLFWSFDQDGSIHEGSAKIEGQALVHEWRAIQGNGRIQDFRSRLRLLDKNNAQLTVEEPQKQGWVTIFQIKYTRAN
ncbi:MAG: hypothetical protein D6813_11865 [Calditrichaeota bacterium]|nr:MAG: hypothetical protein D6813_11865 [Calditrichota bacterium]